MRGIKVRIYPNNEQKVYINKLFGSYRFVYNKCLEYKIDKYTNHKINIGLKQLGNYFHQDLTKNEEFNFLKEHNTKVLKQAIITLLDSYKRFFVNNNGFPKFKSKHSNRQTVTFPKEAISKINDYSTNTFTLNKQLKNIKFKTSKNYKFLLQNNKDKIRSATLSMTKSGKYFVSFTIDLQSVKEYKKPKNEFIGLDLGVKDLVITSENKKYENLKLQRKEEKKLKKLHRKISRKKLGSKNRNKARIRLALKHEKLRNKLNNYLHHITNELVDDNQVIIIESLDVSKMLKNKRLSKYIQEVSFHKFKTLLEYKCNWQSRDLVKLDKYFPSSKLCNSCGWKNKDLSLEDRTWKCKKCHIEHDRDYNAALNILKEGKRLYSLNP